MEINIENSEHWSRVEHKSITANHETRLSELERRLRLIDSEQIAGLTVRTSKALSPEIDPLAQEIKGNKTLSDPNRFTLRTMPTWSNSYPHENEPTEDEPKGTVKAKSKDFFLIRNDRGWDMIHRTLITDWFEMNQLPIPDALPDFVEDEKNTPTTENTVEA